jgi:hypothetical protein
MGPNNALVVKMKIRGCNFLASNMILPIFNVINASKGRLHLLFRQHGALLQKQQTTLP